MSADGEFFVKSRGEVFLWKDDDIIDRFPVVLGPPLILPPGSVLRVVRLSAREFAIYSMDKPTYCLRTHRIFENEFTPATPIEALAYCAGELS